MQQPEHLPREGNGARADRREPNRMLGKLGPGDVVMVTRIDRLARSTFDLFGIVKRIVDTKAQFRSLAEPWAASSSAGRLMLAVLGGLADVERDLIRTRTVEGRSLAKAQGKHMGRPPSLIVGLEQIQRNEHSEEADVIATTMRARPSRSRYFVFGCCRVYRSQDCSTEPEQDSSRCRDLCPSAGTRQPLDRSSASPRQCRSRTGH